MNECLSKFVITSIYIMAGILMLIITDSVYISDVHAQTNTTDIGTKRIIATQKTTASGQNATDVGNNLTQTNATDIGTKRIIATQKTTGISTDPVGNVYVVDADNKVYKSLMAQANS